jgi:hypothetical protein
MDGSPLVDAADVEKSLALLSKGPVVRMNRKQHAQFLVKLD